MRRHAPRLLLFAMTAVAALTGPALAADPHPLNVRDLVMFRRVTEPRPSPDGKRVAFVQRTTDLEANRGRTDIWVVNVDGSGLRQLTSSPEGESNPRWSADGATLFFLSGRGGSDQVWSLSFAGGEAQPVTKLPLDVGAFEVSPDGSRLLVSMEVFPDCADLKCTTDRLAAREKEKATGRIYDELLFRHWDSWEDGRRSHLFVLPVAAGGTAVDLMKGMKADAPSKPFGGPEEFAWTPDGKAVVFSARDVGREEAWSTNFDLFLAPADGASAPRSLTAANKAWDTGPVFSPDGKTLVYRAMTRPGYEADRYRIMVRAWPDGAEREIAKDWDRSADHLAFSADGRTLYATSDDLGNHTLTAIDLATGKTQVVVGDGHVVEPRPAGGVIVFARDHLRSPADLYTVKPQGGPITRITSVNADLLAAVKLGEPEPFTFKGANNDTVHAWIVKPVDFDPAKKYPIAFLIHGGPQGSFGNDFHYRWNPQTYAAAGFAAVMVDFHGSTGYGQAFTDAINGDWGGKPLEDLQKGLAAAIAKYPWMDGNRAAALGASYGGYMINWIAGAWPDRFRCLVSHDGNLDEQFAYFDTEELWFPEWEHKGTPWDNPQGYDKHNPVNLVKNWKTPILVIHGGKDFRVVETQGMGTFTAAQRRGVPSKFLHFPDENHWVLKPANSILWHDTVLDWITTWTK